MQQQMTKEAAEDFLELPRRYNKEDLRKAYTNMARRFHPDAAARHHYDPAVAQERMVQANQANELLKAQFADDPNRVVDRGWASYASSFIDMDWRTGSHEPMDEQDPWSFARDFDAAPPEEPVPLNVRTVLLGPVVLRLLFLLLLGLWWWRAFPLLAQNQGNYVPQDAWSLFDVAKLLAGMVYPSYFFVYELLSGYLSGFVREVANGVVSWVTRDYVDLRPRTSSYGCALYKLIREEVYALLLLPVVVWLAALCADASFAPLRVVLLALTVLVGVDTLASFTRGGYINVWATSLADYVEARYLLQRAKLLRRCGKWQG